MKRNIAELDHISKGFFPKIDDQQGKLKVIPSRNAMQFAEDRRVFIKAGALFLLSMALPSCASAPVRAEPTGKISNTDPKSAAVCWYSQTGNTERAGRLIGATLERKGLKVLKGDYRDLDRSALGDHDMIIAGSPTFYYDVPGNFKEWLRGIPEIAGKPAAAYVTFGGTGGNQHNAACTLLELLTDKGGLPVGLDTFGSMSSFAITWSTGRVERVLKYSNLPDQKSYKDMRGFAENALQHVQTGQSIKFHKGFDFRECLKSSPSIWSTKLLISRHTISKTDCIACGTCLLKCPVGAIDLDKKKIDTDRCIACLGCVNNCPANAVVMVFMGDNVYGYKEFVKRNHIVIPLPKELKHENSPSDDHALLLLHRICGDG